MPSIEGDLRVLIVADDPLARAGLAALLADQPGLAVVGQAAGRADLASELEVYRPDVVLWDLGWNVVPALERLADLMEVGPPVVALLPDSSHAAEAWSAGARGLLLRDAGVSALLAGLRAAHEGLMVIAPEISAAVPRARGHEPVSLAEELTPREREVLKLLAEGLPNKSIAKRLGISEHTVKFHVNAIMGKLGAQSRTEAVIIATHLGLVLL